MRLTGHHAFRSHFGYIADPWPFDTKDAAFFSENSRDLLSLDASDLLVPWTGEPLDVHPVSRRINDVRNDDAALTEPVTAEVQQDDVSSAEPANDSEQPQDEEPEQLPLL